MTTYSDYLVSPPATESASGSLRDPTRSILGPRRDALLFWGAPLAAFLVIQAWLRGWASVAPDATTHVAVTGMFAVIGVTTWAHLIAVVPRAYLNSEVFAAHRLRLTISPVLLIVALLLSPTALAAAALLAVFWDVHHSAMQNFGFTRIYDLKAGNSPLLLRTTDLRLNWLLYVGPLTAGAALVVHLQRFAVLDGTMLAALTAVPGILAGHNASIRVGAITLYLLVLGWAAIDYAYAIRAGYRMPPHKMATIVVTGTVSILAWGFTPPIVALATVNLYHAVQYFALVWVKEHGRMRSGTRIGSRTASLCFWGGSILFGLLYAAAVTGSPAIILAPFVACSLLHFWYDSFVWSVRKRTV